MVVDPGLEAVVRVDPVSGDRTVLQPPILCQPGPNILCLQDDRFQVEVDWEDFQGNTGPGQAVQLTPESGYFWFFNPDNIELVVKVLDACDLADFNKFWVFAAGLTNVEVTLVVTDTQTGESRGYSNPLGQAFPPIQDTSAFATCP